MLHFHTINQQSLELRRAGGAASCNKGIWYWDDYFSVLKNMGTSAHTRLTKLIAQNNFYHGYVPSNFFEPIRDLRFATKRAPFSFILKEGVVPSKALEALVQGPCILDCSTVLQVSVFLALKDLLGETRFNMLFASDSPNRLTINAHWENLLGGMFTSVPIKSTADIRKGDICNIVNIPLYPDKHPGGCATSFNICCDQDAVTRTYTGFGLPAGATQEDIERVLFDSFNRDPVNPGTFHPGGTVDVLKQLGYKETPLELRTKRMEWSEFSAIPVSYGETQAQGKLLLRVIRLRTDRIAELVSAPVDKIRKVYEDFFKYY